MFVKQPTEFALEGFIVVDGPLVVEEVDEQKTIDSYLPPSAHPISEFLADNLGRTQVGFVSAFSTTHHDLGIPYYDPYTPKAVSSAFQFDTSVLQDRLNQDASVIEPGKRRNRARRNTRKMVRQSPTLFPLT